MGARSRAAAAILAENGFTDVFSMEGGIRAWEGLVAEGAPESGMAYFSPASDLEELISLAWVLEDGSGRFYGETARIVRDSDAKKVFEDLADAENHHKAALISLYRELSKKEPDPDFPASRISGESDRDVMEGGMRVSEALRWIRDKDAEAVLELAMGLEANSYDLYLRMRRHLQDERSKHVFDSLAEEEKRHLEKLAALIEKKV